MGLYAGKIEVVSFDGDSLWEALQKSSTWIRDRQPRTGTLARVGQISVEDVLVDQDTEFMTWEVTVYYRAYEER